MRTSSAELAPDAFRAAGHALVDRIADFLAAQPGLAVAPSTTPSAIRELIGASATVPAIGSDAHVILSEAAELLLGHSTLNGNPRFFGYITSSAAPIGALADLLASAVNANCGAWALSPVATEMERQTVRWIAELIGYPTNAGGILVSGGNMANMVALIAGLRSVAGHDVRARGLAGGAKLAVYASSEVHTWFQKGADLCGLGTDAVRSIRVDGSLAMDVEALEQQIRDDLDAGWKPAFVVGTAGSVGIGAIDPLREIGALCAEHGIWFHVDGAYGAPAAMLPDAPDSLRALSIADSAAVDPHKWLYAPLEVGCTLVRDPQKLLNAFSFHPVYYRFGGDATDPPTNFYEWGPQNSRGNRALKVWATIRQSGREGYVRMLSEDIELSRAMYRLAAEHDELEALTQSLSITTFRYVPRELWGDRGAPRVEKYLNDLNAKLLERLQSGGEVYLSNAIVRGSFALRACIVNFRTTMADADAVISAAVREGRALHATAGSSAALAPS